MAVVNKLKLEYEFDLTIIGLSSHTEDYKLCWLINNKIDWQMVRSDNLPSYNKSESLGLFSVDEVSNIADGFTMFSFIDDDNFIDNHLLANFSNTGYLIPEYKQCNYFIILRGDATNENLINFVIDSLGEIDEISSIIPIDVKTIRDATALMF